MKKYEKNNGYPTLEPDEEEDFFKYSCPSASSGDMTGLIPFNAEEKDSVESYNEMYPYLPEDYAITNDETDKK